MSIKWETPEPSKGGRKSLLDWDAVAAELRERPGEWALILENASSGIAVTAKRHGLEVTVRGVDNTTGIAAKFYARWPEDAK